MNNDQQGNRGMRHRRGSGEDRRGQGDDRRENSRPQRPGYDQGGDRRPPMRDRGGDDDRRRFGDSSRPPARPRDDRGRGRPGFEERSRGGRPETGGLRARTDRRENPLAYLTPAQMRLKRFREMDEEELEIDPEEIELEDSLRSRTLRVSARRKAKKKKVRVFFHRRLTRILLPKLLIRAKYLSPALAKQFVEAGRVRVNARQVTSLYYEVNLRKERVTIDDVPAEYPRRLSYMIFNKPRGVVCDQLDDAFAEIFDPESVWGFPFGRLTKSLSGLVVLSNDPRIERNQHYTDEELQKEYKVKVNRHLTDEELAELKSGVMVDDDYFIPQRVSVLPSGKNFMILEFILLDDSYHKIFKALKALGAEAVTVRRSRIGRLDDTMIPYGEWRELSSWEISSLGLGRFIPGDLPPEPEPEFPEEDRWGGRGRFDRGRPQRGGRDEQRDGRRGRFDDRRGRDGDRPSGGDRRDDRRDRRWDDRERRGDRRDGERREGGRDGRRDGERRDGERREGGERRFDRGGERRDREGRDQRFERRDERPRDDRPRDDRPRDDRRRDDGGRGERPQEGRRPDRFRDERRRDDRSGGDRPRDDRPRDDRPRDDRPRHERPRDERPREDRGREQRGFDRGDRRRDDRADGRGRDDRRAGAPGNDRRAEGDRRDRGDRRFGDDRRGGERQDRRDGERGRDRRDGEERDRDRDRRDGERRNGDRPGGDRPGGDRPNGDVPGGDRPAGERPDGGRSDDR